MGEKRLKIPEIHEYFSVSLTPTRQRERFANLLDALNVSTWKRAHRTFRKGTLDSDWTNLQSIVFRADQSDFFFVICWSWAGHIYFVWRAKQGVHHCTVASRSAPQCLTKNSFPPKKAFSAVIFLLIMWKNNLILIKTASKTAPRPIALAAARLTVASCLFPLSSSVAL